MPAVAALSEGITLADTMRQWPALRRSIMRAHSFEFIWQNSQV
jgi:hypothetical protein